MYNYAGGKYDSSVRIIFHQINIDDFSRKALFVMKQKIGISIHAHVLLEEQTSSESIKAGSSIATISSMLINPNGKITKDNLMLRK